MILNLFDVGNKSETKEIKLQLLENVVGPANAS